MYPTRILCSNPAVQLRYPDNHGNIYPRAGNIRDRCVLAKSGLRRPSYRNTPQVKKMKHSRILLIGSLCMICLIAAVMPAGAAPVNGTAWNINPEHIAAMQAFVAYAGAKGQAQMDGTISYLGTISNNAGTSQLSSIESQFTGTVSSVQSMTTGDQIRDAETQLSADRKDFMTTAKESLREYNGTGKLSQRASTHRSWHSRRRSRLSKTRGGQTDRPPAWMSSRQTTSAGPVSFQT